MIFWVEAGNNSEKIDLLIRQAFEYFPLKPSSVRVVIRERFGRKAGNETIR